MPMQYETMTLIRNASARLARNSAEGAVEDMRTAMRAGADMFLAGTPDGAARAMAAHGNAYMKSVSARIQSVMLDADEIRNSLFAPMYGIAKPGNSKAAPQGA
ncbi:hypothetical protein [Roseibium sp. RKSG952]|uniref:hypothetical protein n=1 Tax=Roseibium sp. RKSG952 TaxID=2529384 RepID=UPI0012BCEC0C|nr:hypothetical protein [Roseibium sp. RKSG952]MTH95360.1 hypothetical protein [Roseibium sp. RKSG952]